MQKEIIIYLLMIVAILLLVMLAEKLKVAYPIILVLGGLGITAIPGLPVIMIDPGLIFTLFLPPLLYDAAFNTSWKEFWRWRRVIGSFAFLVVLLTSLIIAVVSNALLPGFGLALGFLLGGIISPPDAISATSIMRHVKVPKRVSAIIEGESLLNDASSLIVFRFALIAIETGSFVFREAALDFFLVILGGIIAGILISLIFYVLHRWLPTDSNTDIVLTILAPYTMYIVAEHLHVSGVLAVVSGGLFLSPLRHVVLRSRSRIQARNVWSTLTFLLNGVVFLLIGLQLPVIVSGLGTLSLAEAIGHGVLISLVLIATRLLCAYGGSIWTVFLNRYIKTEDPRPGWKGPTIFGWAGMRGVVSLAAALSIPHALPDGTPFPQRNLILFITFMVILLTLVIQGLTLPSLIKWINMPDPDNHLPARQQEWLIRRKLAEQGIAFLNAIFHFSPSSNKALNQLKERYELESTLPQEIEGLEQTDFRNVYAQLLAKQHEYLHEINRENGWDEEIIRKFHDMIDLEEERLIMKYEQPLT